MKELNINGKVYAYYEIDGKMLFLNMQIQIIPGKENAIKSENVLVQLIAIIEQADFDGVGYLNFNTKH